MTRRENGQRYYLKHKPRLKIQHAIWRKNNQQYIKDYQDNRKEITKKYNRNYYLEHKDKILEYQKKYDASHEIKRDPKKLLKNLIKYLERNAKLHNFDISTYQYALFNWSQAIKKRDNNTCQICNKMAEHAHHILPKAKYPDLTFNLNNGISLCVECHQQTHF